VYYILPAATKDLYLRRTDIIKNYIILVRSVSLEKQDRECIFAKFDEMTRYVEELNKMLPEKENYLQNLIKRRACESNYETLILNEIKGIPEEALSRAIEAGLDSLSISFKTLSELY
jgi:hypothetical protein